MGQSLAVGCWCISWDWGVCSVLGQEQGCVPSPEMRCPRIVLQPLSLGCHSSEKRPQGTGGWQSSFFVPRALSEGTTRLRSNESLSFLIVSFFRTVVD